MKQMGMRGLPYGVSKAALNYITAVQSQVYGVHGIKVFAYTPGFVVSDLGPHNNVESGAQPTSAGAAPIVRIINGERDDELPIGGFLRENGQHPW
jgi:NAD(P)-dependent dehydrogenase (short-subunit alcohol dehydrogenase family)